MCASVHGLSCVPMGQVSTTNRVTRSIYDKWFVNVFAIVRVVFFLGTCVGGRGQELALVISDCLQDATVVEGCRSTCAQSVIV